MVLLTLLQWDPVDLIAIPPTPFNLHLDTAVVRVVGWMGGGCSYPWPRSLRLPLLCLKRTIILWRLFSGARMLEVKCQKCVQVLENGSNTF